jgi:hypothetical protein
MTRPFWITVAIALVIGGGAAVLYPHWVSAVAPAYKGLRIAWPDGSRCDSIDQECLRKHFPEGGLLRVNDEPTSPPKGEVKPVEVKPEPKAAAPKAKRRRHSE